VPGILLLTGTCASGKTTVSSLLGVQAGWARLAEDEIWPHLFGRDRGAFDSDEHRRKRAAVHDRVFRGIIAALSQGSQIVIDATVHEAPPDAFLEYRAFFEALEVPWAVRVLHPRLEVAVARDSRRTGWRAGATRVAELRAKFTGKVFPPDWFVDTSDEEPAETLAHLHRLGVV
jgi:predicted kinase